MVAKKKFYVTTPIYYPNDIPHIGHAYTTVAADILSRWNKLQGKEVFFLTGTDEHGKKIQEAAEKVGKTPKEFVDFLIPKFKEAWKKLNIEYSQFIRTTDKAHETVVKEILTKCHKNGDIYKGFYEGLYCTGCEAYYTEKDAPDKQCPIHKRPLECLKEETYFFKLEKYEKKLLELYKKNPEFIQPEAKRNEIISKVKEGIKDFSISRTSFKWGVELPFDKKHVSYVWFDALLNYYSATCTKDKKKFWPADLHLIGKDILWFHTVYWPAMLMSAGIKTPKTIFAHGWWTFNKEKISKSRGKIINVDELISIAGVDSARYFLFRETPFGQDGDFSEQALVERHNNELANKLGNLVSRVSALIEANGMQKVPNKLLKKLNQKAIEKHLDNYEFDKALNEIFAFIDHCNEYVQEKKPWETKDKKVLYELADSIKSAAILLSPFMPGTSEKIGQVFNFKIDYKEIKKPLAIKSVKKAPILFQKIEVKQENKEIGKIIKPQTTDTKMVEGIANIVDFTDWQKLDLRVGEVDQVEDIPGADKLYKLSVTIGSQTKTICAGLKQFYSREELKGKKVIVFSNLAPRKMKGIESQGMLLAAVNKDETKVSLLQPDEDIEIGSRVM